MTADDEKIYLVEEHAVVSKRLEATDVVRVHTLVHTDAEVIATPVETEQIEVERVLIDRWVDAPIPERQEGNTRVITLHAEVVVTETRLKATEEIRITRRRQTRQLTERVTLRREEAVVERAPVSARANDEQG